MKTWCMIASPDPTDKTVLRPSSVDATIGREISGVKMSAYRAEDLTQADRDAAHEFLTELRTRISTQPLPYQYGVEERALGSLREVFDHAREAIKTHPGCKIFAQQTTDMLNVVLRPLTAKWHRALTDGRLKARDGCNEFRGDLEAVRYQLREFASELHHMAYGEPDCDRLASDVMKDDDLDDCLKELQSGIHADKLIDAETAERINDAERVAIEACRKLFDIPEQRKNAVGLGLSGGGIRSATFCLGVVQVLADRELLKDVDYLSTVWGGGYTGSFLTRQLKSANAYFSVPAPHGRDPDPVRYLRQHAKYLTASELKKPAARRLRPFYSGKALALWRRSLPTNCLQSLSLLPDLSRRASELRPTSTGC
jgi:hypothetical protein